MPIQLSVAAGISIHTTLAGGDGPTCKVSNPHLYFNPHHPRGWRLSDSFTCEKFRHISIHTTLAGGDFHVAPDVPRHKEFQSTPPSRVATDARATPHGNTPAFQSTPPSRVATRKYVFEGRSDWNFNPHHPRGWRLLDGDQVSLRLVFQSTPPSRVATGWTDGL